MSKPRARAISREWRERAEKSIDKLGVVFVETSPPVAQGPKHRSFDDLPDKASDLLRWKNEHGRADTRVRFTDSTLSNARPLFDADAIPPVSDGAHWLGMFFETSADAIIDAAKLLVRTPDLSKLGTNTLSAIGNAVSTAVRREILLRVLESVDWNLARASETLGLGGSGNVTKAIEQLGLDDQLAAARRAGKAKPGRPSKTING